MKKLQYRGCAKLIDIWSSQLNSNPKKIIY